MIKTLSIATLVCAFALSGCTTTETDIATGAAVGAVVGGATGGAEGAAAGAAIGAGGGLLVRNLRNGYCQYRDPRTGRIYTARC